MPQRGVFTGGQWLLIFFIGQVAFDSQIGGQRQANDVVEVGHGQVVGVTGFDEGLVGLGERYFATQHVDLGDYADLELDLDILQILFEPFHRFFAEFDGVTGRHQFEEGVGGVIFEGLPGGGDAPLAGIQGQFRLADLALDLVAGPDGPVECQGIGKLVVNEIAVAAVIPVIILFAVPSPGVLVIVAQGRPAIGTGGGQRALGGFEFETGDLAARIVAQGHIDGLIQRDFRYRRRLSHCRV